MPFSPSDFEWWMWLLFAVGAIVVCSICVAVASWGDEHNEGITTFVFGVCAFVAGLAGAGCFLIALVRFAKWAWGN
jgi:hypothetical protein